MSGTLVDQYQRILQADPRSLVFVSLAKELIAGGDPARAADVCRHGLEHHPRSIQGRVMLGRALLAAGDVAGGLAVLREAAAVEPDNPYGWNLATEAAAAYGFEPRALLAARVQPGPPPEPSLLAVAAEGAGASPSPPASPGQPGAASPGPGAPPSGGEGSTAPRRSPPPLAPARASPGLLRDLPGAAAAPAAAPASETPTAEIADLAASYERQLRARAEAAPAPAGPRRHTILLAALATVLGIALAVGIGTYFASRRAHRTEDARALAEDARRGILRDTEGSNREASRALAEAAALDATEPRVRSLAALSFALRAVDFDDSEARAAAERALASGDAGEASPAVRFLLAAPADRATVASAAAGPVPSAPVVSDAIAGEALAAAGDATGSAAHLEAAARSVPPSLRALSRLGERALARGEPEEAMGWLSAALAAHPTHPGAALRAAEARLSLQRDLPEALASLRAVEADPASPPTVDDRQRFELAFARLLAASGQRGAAADRLTAAAGRLGASPALLVALAEVHLSTGACDEAEGEARKALQGADLPSARVAVARALLCRGRLSQLLAETAGQDTREIRVVRADARLAGGDARGALAEIEPLGRERRMPADAAARYAIALVRLDRATQARAVVERLLAMPHPSATALVAAAELSWSGGDRADAEQRYRAALEAEPELAEAHCGLGRLLLAEGRTLEATNELTRALALAPGHAEASQALERALHPGAASSAPQRRQRPASTKLK